MLIPVALSGAIHLDGFCDTADALGSRQTRERKLEILKDPGAGAFALISCCAYLLVYAALWSETGSDPRGYVVLAVVPVLSRALSGLSVVTFRNARGDGLLATFSKAAQTGVVRTVMALWIAAAAAAMIILNPLPGLGAVLGAVITFTYYRIMSYRQFGGTTGDVAGYFLQLGELMSLLVFLLVEKLGTLA